MHNTSNGWRVIGVANARELVRTHDKALDTWRERVVTGFRAENRRRLDIMHKHYQVLSCKAFLAKNLGAESDVPLVITLEGVNIGRYKLMSAGMSCMLYGQDGSLAASVPLNTTKIVEPGIRFRSCGSWNCRVILSRRAGFWPNLRSRVPSNFPLSR